MQTSSTRILETRRHSILTVLRDLATETRTLFRQEVQLAKTEFAHIAGRLAKNSAMLAAGAAVAFGGFIVLLVGLGWLAAWLLVSAGLQPMLAAFIGASTIGLVSAAIGGALLFKGVRNLSHQPLVPTESMEELTGKTLAAAGKAQAKAQENLSLGEVKAQVEATERRMAEDLDELTHRLSPQHINAEVKQRLQARPYSAGLAALLAGLLSGLLLSRKPRHA